MAKKQREEMKKVLNAPIDNHMRLLIDIDYKKDCTIQADLDRALTDDAIEECVFNAAAMLIHYIHKNTGRPIKDVMSVLIQNAVPLNISKVKGGNSDGKFIH